VVFFPKVLRQARVVHAVVVNIINASVKVLKERDTRQVFSGAVRTDIVGGRGEFAEGRSGIATLLDLADSEGLEDVRELEEVVLKDVSYDSDNLID
jgi:hypothetical protein